MVCKEHAGFRADIDNLKKDIAENKDVIKEVSDKLDAIKTYLMTLFGGITVAIVLLLLQIVMRFNQIP